eukprot:s739_g24.t1
MQSVHDKVQSEDSGVEPLRKRKGPAMGETGNKCHSFGSPPKRKRLDEGPLAAEELPHNMAKEPAFDQHQKVDASDPSVVQSQLKRLIFLLDLFCGTAGVAAAFRAEGGDALGLDHMIDKRRVKGPVAKVDLSKRSGQQTVLSWINEDKVDAVMLAPPCGTSSRAREIPIPKKFRLRSGMQPAPLRSDDWPNGLPHLKGVAKIKVETANKLYKFTREVIEACVAKNIPVICENPKRSLLWATDAFQDLPDVCRFQYVHACMYGSKRRKSTGLLMNFAADNLQSLCSGDHPHLPWGLVCNSDNKMQFSTSLETEYPTLFCKQLVRAFLAALHARGKTISPAHSVEDQIQKMGAGTQPRGLKSPILMGEFKLKVDVTSNDVEIPGTISEQVHYPFQGVPLNAKLISSRVIEKGVQGEKSEKSVCHKSTFGVYRTPWEFFLKTLELQHPLDSPQLVDRSNLRAILFIRDHTASEVALFRTQQLKRFINRASELTAAEAKLKDSLDIDVRIVLQGKRLLLFEEMAEEAGVGDAGLFQELITGFSLTGEMPESKQFPAKLKPALISVQQLKESSVWAKKMIFASCRRMESDPEVARAVYDETMQQLQDGWVKGPFSEAQLDAKYKGCWIPSKRFGVRQGTKIRAVDDFSEFLINASVSSTEKLQLFGIDEVINTARTFLGCDCVTVDDTLSWIQQQPGVPHHVALWRSLQGRALDFKAAYKQLARSPGDAWASILAVWNYEAQSVEFFESVALPFGSVCAVMAFNRMARALRLILSELFMLVNTNFFDDFCQLEINDLCESSWSTAELVMDLHGWRISLSEEKRLPFAKEFNMLGAVVDLSETKHGVVRVRNKDSRVKDIGELVEDVCARQLAPASLMETLKGRLLYAAGHTFGRCTQLALQMVSRLGRRGPLILVDEEFRSVLRHAFRCLSTAKPREVGAWSGRPPIVIFTDGACEDDGKTVTHGATLYDPESGLSLMFGDDVPPTWTERPRGTVTLLGDPYFGFIDNNSALSAVIRAFSAVLENYDLLVINADLDVRLQCLSWYSRVPSKSNLSDSPSRLDFKELVANGFTRRKPQYKSLTIHQKGEEA